MEKTKHVPNHQPVKLECHKCLQGIQNGESSKTKVVGSPVSHISRERNANLANTNEVCSEKIANILSKFCQVVILQKIYLQVAIT